MGNPPSCLCGTCKKCLNRRWMATYRSQKARGIHAGRYAVSSNAPRLYRLGHTVESMWQLSGIPARRTVERAVQGLPVYTYNAAALDALTVTDLLFHPSLPAKGVVPGRHVHRRLDALQWNGWRLQDIAERLDVQKDAVQKYRKARSHQRGVLLRVSEVYADLENQWGPSDLTRMMAQSRGWAPPAAWDDIDLDARPQGVNLRSETA